MIRMNSDQTTSTLLGTSQGPLELRVVGTQLAGQTVKLNAAKCTIGSGNRCTLRLQARRVEPVHCLILRGENGTVIRRWSPHTRLNGATFTDALLQAGDRLTIGPIELDVVSTGLSTGAVEQVSQPAAPEKPATPAVPPTDSAEYARLKQELVGREAELKASEELLSELQADIAAQRREWEKTQAEHEAELKAKLEEQQAKLDSQRKEHQAELETRREEHEALTHELNNLRQLKQDLPDLLEDRQQSDAQRSKNPTGEKELAEAQAKFKAESAAQEAELNKRKEELAQQANTLESAWKQLDDDRAELAEKQKAAETAFEQREEEINRRQTELEKSVAEAETANLEQAKDLQQREQIWQHSQAAWAAERQVWNTTCHESSLELQNQQAELESQKAELEAAREELAKQREELEAAQAAFAEQQAAVMHAEKTDRTAAASLFNAEQEEACDEEAFESASSEKSVAGWMSKEDHAEENRQLHDDSAESMKDAEEQPEASSSDENESSENDQPEKGLTLAERLLGSHLSEMTPREDAAEHENYSSVDAEPPAFEEVATASPAESSGLMDRLRAMADWDDEEQPESGRSKQAPSSSSQSAFEPMIPIPSNPAKSAAGTPGSVGAPSDDDEESIEDYMAKLMSRVRGEETHTLRPPVIQSRAPEPKPVPKPEPEVSDAQTGSAPSVPEEPFEMAAPRQMPVELTSNLAAMRELANLTARDAIDTSIRNRWSQAATGKFTVAGLALLSAGLLLFWSNHLLSLQVMGAGVAILVAFFWGLQGVIISRNVKKANKVLAEKAHDSELEAERMRQMLYADDTEIMPTQNAPESAAQTESNMDDDVVVIENSIEPTKDSE